MRGLNALDLLFILSNGKISKGSVVYTKRGTGAYFFELEKSVNERIAKLFG